jgi:hypothetical protein
VNSNTKYLLKRWIVPLLLGSLMVFGFARAVLRGEYLMPVVVTVVAVVLFLLMWRSKQQALRFFQDTTPNRAVEHYHRTMSRAPNGEALAAYMCGLVLALYGEYDEARTELSRVSWANFPPMYDGFRTYVLSIIALLEKRDFSKALDLALEARDLSSTSTILPGAATSKRTLDAHVLACELLANPKREDVASALEKSVKTLPGFAPVISLWSLANHYNSIGETQSADAHMTTLRRLVPNCKPLMNSA